MSVGNQVIAPKRPRGGYPNNASCAHARYAAVSRPRCASRAFERPSSILKVFKEKDI